MKKLFSGVLALSLLAVPVSSPVFAADNSSSIKIIMDGKDISSDQPPVIQNGRTLVPLRSIFEALGAQVKWDSSTQKIEATKDATTLNLTVGSKVATKNDSILTLDQEPIIMNSRTLVPIRFVSESLGEEVVWDDSTQTVTITASTTNSSNNAGTQTDNSQNSEVNNQSTDAAQQSAPTSITGKANAVTTTNSPTVNKDASELTYQQAMDMAKASSYTLRSAQADIDKSKYTVDKAADNIGVGNFTPTTGGNTSSTSAYTTYTQAEIARQTAYKNLQKLQDQIAYQVKAAYNAVILAIDNQKLSEAALQNAEVQYQVNIALHNNGMLSDADFQKAQNSLDTAKTNRQQVEKAINDAYQSLNNLIGLGPDARPTLSEIPEMKKLDSSVDVDTKVTQAISQSPTIWSDQQQVTTAKLAVNLFTFNNHSSTETYQGKQLDVTKAQNQVQVDTDNLDKSVRSTYYSIKQAEDQYDSLLNQMSTDQTTLKTLQAQYNAGMATKAQLIAAQYALAKDQNSQLSLIISHDNNLMVLDKPWVSGK